MRTLPSRVRLAGASRIVNLTKRDLSRLAKRFIRRRNKEYPPESPRRDSSNTGERARLSCASPSWLSSPSFSSAACGSCSTRHAVRLQSALGPLYCCIVVRLSRSVHMAKIRIGYVVGGRFRRLLSLAENGRGEVVIGIRSAENYFYNSEGTKILQQKYSVHASLDSERYSTITHTIVLSDGRKLRSYSVTDAIKSRSGFALLFSRRCPDLSNDRYLLENSKKFTPVVLGEYDSRRATPVFAVHVGGAETEFKPSKTHEFAITEIPFAKLKLIIIHGFLGTPSHRTGDLLHGMTFKPESAPPDLQDHLWSLMKGRDEDTSVDFAREMFRNLLAKHIRYVLKNEQLGGWNASWLMNLLKAMGEPITDEAEGPDGTVTLWSLDRRPSCSPR